MRVTYKNTKVNLIPIFIIENMDLGDPCVNDEGIEKFCNGNGLCVPKRAVDQYECNCRQGWFSENCSKRDWCRSVVTVS